MKIRLDRGLIVRNLVRRRVDIRWDLRVNLMREILFLDLGVMMRIRNSLRRLELNSVTESDYLKINQVMMPQLPTLMISITRIFLPNIGLDLLIEATCHQTALPLVQVNIIQLCVHQKNSWELRCHQEQKQMDLEWRILLALVHMNHLSIKRWWNNLDMGWDLQKD